MPTAEQIWQDADLPTRRLAGLALNPSAPLDVLLRLLADGPLAARMVLCRDRVLPEVVVDAVIGHPDPATRAYLARNRLVEPAVRARLVDDLDWRVRATLAHGFQFADDKVSPLPDETVVHMMNTYDNESLGGAFFQQFSLGLRHSGDASGREGPPLGSRHVGVVARGDPGRAARGPRRRGPGTGGEPTAPRGSGVGGERSARPLLPRPNGRPASRRSQPSRRGRRPHRSGRSRGPVDDRGQPQSPR